MCTSANWDAMRAMAWSQLATPASAAARHAATRASRCAGRPVMAVAVARVPSRGSLRRPPRTQPMVKPGPTPRISCEARLNEEEPILDTYLQVSALRQLHPLVRRRHAGPRALESGAYAHHQAPLLAEVADTRW